MKSDKISSVLNNFLRGGIMQLPEVVEQIFYLKKKGWGTKRISKQLQISRNTIKRYIRQNGWAPYKKQQKPKKLEGLQDWLEEQFYRHKGNAVVIQQELLCQHQKKVSLRTIQYAVQPFRQKLFAETHATVRFETPPG